jgi:hypothetical protein
MFDQFRQLNDGAVKATGWPLRRQPEPPSDGSDYEDDEE